MSGHRDLRKNREDGNAINYYGSFTGEHAEEDVEVDDDQMFSGKMGAYDDYNEEDRLLHDSAAASTNENDKKRRKTSASVGIFGWLRNHPWTVSASLLALVVTTSTILLFVRIKSTYTTIDVTIEESSFGQRPHIIFMLADDLGWNSLGYHNYDLGDISPTLTDLAQNGMILDSYYAQEVCTPSRGALMTGILLDWHFIIWPACSKAVVFRASSADAGYAVFNRSDCDPVGNERNRSIDCSSVPR
jgi:hypothetical protein